MILPNLLNSYQRQMASFECQVPGWLGQNKNSKQIKFHLDNKRQIRIGETVDAEPQGSHDLCIKMGQRDGGTA